MSENKKYFYMKVKDTFFDSEEMKILESQKNGFLYQNVYLKMCLLSLKNEGELTFKGIMPYNIEMLSTVLRIDIDTVKTACEIFVKLGLVTITDTETMYMTDIQSLIGQSSTEAERVKKYRQRISNDTKRSDECTKSVQMLQNCTPEKEKEKEKETETEKEKEKDNSHKAKNSKSELFDTVSSFSGNETLRKLLSSWLKERLQDSRMSKEVLELNLSMLKQYGNGDEQKMIDKVSERLAAGHRALIYSNDLKEKNNGHKERQSQYSMAYDDTVTHDYSAENNIVRDENGEIVEIGF